jgi:hypothetical protein
VLFGIPKRSEAATPGFSFSNDWKDPSQRRKARRVFPNIGKLFAAYVLKIRNDEIIGLTPVI